MSFLPNLIFAVIAFGAMGIFAFNLKKIWGWIRETGAGEDIERMDNHGERMAGMIKGGFLQLKMFKDMPAAIMHSMIFWGFILVTIGTVETIIHGLYTPFTFKTILGDSFLYKLYLSSQDIGNFMVLAAIIWALVRRMFFSPKRLSSLTKESKNDAFIVLGFILGLVFTAHLYMGAKTFAPIDQSLPGGALTISKGIAGAVGGMFGLEAEGWLSFSKVSWWVHCLCLFGFMAFLPYSKHQHLIWVWPNMFFRSLRGRGPLRKMVFDENAESFGARRIST